MKEVMTGVSVLPGENENGKRGVDFNGEGGLCVGSAYFEYRNVHKYT